MKGNRLPGLKIGTLHDGQGRTTGGIPEPAENTVFVSLYVNAKGRAATEEKQKTPELQQ